MIGSTEDFRAVCASAGLQGAARDLAEACGVIGYEWGRLILNLPAKHRDLRTPEAQDEMWSALARRLGNGLRIDIRVVRGCSA